MKLSLKMLSELRYDTVAEQWRFMILMWTSNDMSKTSITEKGRNGTGAEESGKYNSPKLLRNSVGEAHQSLFPHLEAGFDVKKSKAHSSQYPHISFFLT